MRGERAAVHLLFPEGRTERAAALYRESLAAQYRSMDAEKLNGAMRTALNPKTLTWVIVGDAAKVEPQLKELGMPVEVRRAAPAAGDK